MKARPITSPESRTAVGTARTTISMPAALFTLALGRKEARNFGAFSDYIQDLVRKDVGTPTENKQLLLEV